jgi:branched-subunit amino acid ABC-type transport system permease component
MRRTSMFGDYSIGDLGSIFVMQGFAGLILFSVYVLMALGLAIIFGQMGVINMAHGEFMILGAYTTYMTRISSRPICRAVRRLLSSCHDLAVFALAGALGCWWNGR